MHLTLRDFRLMEYGYDRRLGRLDAYRVKDGLNAGGERAPTGAAYA